MKLTEYLKGNRTPWGEKYENSKYQGDDKCCIVCGKMSPNGIRVALTGGGDDLVLPDSIAQEEKNYGEYMGVWTVGPECGSKIPTKYRIETNEGKI
jgi:hypothetical protein